jgi:hypothetical protein
LRRFAINMKALAAANSSWMEIALSPSDARRIIRANKLAIVLATEVDDLGDHCSGDFTNTAADDPMDHAKTTTSVGVDPWNQIRDTVNAASCTTAAEWTTRVDNLYRVGYRVIMPVHLADNDLGGTAIYNPLFNTNNRFMTGAWVGVTLANDVTWTYPRNPNNGQWASSEMGWTNHLGWVAGVAAYTPALIEGWVAYPYPSDHTTNMMANGHVNVRPLTSNGVTVLEAARARGLIIDIAHLDQLGREHVLGLTEQFDESSVPAERVPRDLEPRWIPRDAVCP